MPANLSETDSKEEYYQELRVVVLKSVRGVLICCFYFSVAALISEGADSISTSSSRGIHDAAVTAGGSVSFLGKYIFFFFGLCIASMPSKILLSAIKTIILLDQNEEDGKVLGAFIITFPFIIFLWKAFIFGSRMFATDGTGILVIFTTFILVFPTMLVAHSRSSDQSFSTSTSDQNHFAQQGKEVTKKTLLLLAQTVLVMYTFGISRYFSWLPLMEGHPRYTYSGPMCVTISGSDPEVNWGGEWGCPLEPTKHCTVRVRQTRQPLRTIGPNGEFYSYPSQIHSQLQYEETGSTNRGFDGDVSSGNDCFANTGKAKFLNVIVLGDCNNCEIPQIATYEALGMLKVMLGGILFYGGIILVIEASIIHNFFYKWFIGNLEIDYGIAPNVDEEAVNTSIKMVDNIKMDGKVAHSQGACTLQAVNPFMTDKIIL